MKLGQLSLLCIFGFLSLSAQARIGETEAQCNARYGPPLAKVAQGDKQYSKNGYTILVWFKNGVVAQIQYTRGFKDVFDWLKEEEVDSLLNSNSGGSSWKRPSKWFMRWEREDGKVTAAGSSGKRGTMDTLTIMTKDWELEKEALSKKEAADQKAKIEAEKKKRLQGL